MDKRAFKDKVYTLSAKLIQAMANPRRLEIIDLLGQGERSVEEIARETAMSVANTSQHLQVLKQSNLVQLRREGNFIRYRLANDKVYQSWQDLRMMGMESLAEMDRLITDFRRQKNSLHPVTLEDLLVRMRSKNTILLDVRPEGEFQAGHIPRAINVPIDRLASRIRELDKSMEYIAYCRGPFCVFADEAVELLVKKGFKASRLEEGFPDWKLRFPVESVS